MLNEATIKMREAIANNYIKYVNFDELAERLGKTKAYKTAIFNFTSDKADRNMSAQFQRHLVTLFDIDFVNDTAKEISEKINNYWILKKSGKLNSKSVEVLQQQINSMQQQLNVIQNALIRIEQKLQ